MAMNFVNGIANAAYQYLIGAPEDVWMGWLRFAFGL